MAYTPFPITPGAGSGGGGGSSVHNDLTGRSAADAHPTSAITGLSAALAAAGNVDSVNGQTGTVSLDLDDLTDVDTTTDPPDADDVLAWDGVTWTPATLTALGAPGLSNATPADLGTAAPGVSEAVSRDDHVHDLPTAAQVGALDASAGFNTANGWLKLDGDGTVPDNRIPSTITRDSELTAAISAAIDALLDGVPGALDTLNELAAAINDDASFAASVTTALAGKVPTARTVAGLDLSTDRTAAALKTALAIVTGDVSGLDAALALLAPKTRTVGTGLATTGSVALDMAAVHGTIQTIALTGDPTFSTSNRAAGREVTLIIAAGGSTRTLTWPSWLAVGAALPTSLASGKTLVVSVTFVDTTDAAAIVAAAVQP